MLHILKIYYLPGISPAFRQFLGLVNWDIFFDCCIGMVVQIQMSPLTICEFDKCSSGQMSNGKLSGWTIVHMDDCPHGRLSAWTIVRMDDCPLAVSDKRSQIK